ncbi:hypothetical protein M153_25710000387, partial [Pseudoloma neurophilia]
MNKDDLIDSLFNLSIGSEESENFIRCIITINDKSVQLGSFAKHELVFNHLINLLCLKRKLNKLNLCDNSGVRVQLDNELMEKVVLSKEYLMTKKKEDLKFLIPFLNDFEKNTGENYEKLEKNHENILEE